MAFINIQINRNLHTKKIQMHSKKTLLCIIMMCASFRNTFSQNVIGSYNHSTTETLTADNIQKKQGEYKKLIIPVVFIGYGVASLKINALRQLNRSTRYEILEDKPDRLKLDNYTQYIPAALVYGLNTAGIKGKHNLRDRTIIYITSQLISTGFVLPLKYTAKEERPDGSNNLSFPSGHTATAFSSAQFMFREYKESNFWLSISGYSFAVFTGVYRTINNKHWVGDVVAGAGFGILSTELSYWLYPRINSIFAGSNKKFLNF